MHTLQYWVPPALQQATADARLWWRPLGTHRQVLVSLLWGSLLLSPGSWCTQGFVCVLQESVSPVLCKYYVSSGGSIVGLMVTSSKSPHAIPKSAAPRAPAICKANTDPYLHRRHWKAGLAQFLWGLLVHTRFCLSLLNISDEYGAWF